MITKKYWNTLNLKTKNEILNTVWSKDIVDSFGRSSLTNEYHYDFGHDRIGKTLKATLDSCYLQPDKTLKVCVSITPKFDSPVSKKVEPKPELYEWDIDYEDKEGDLCHIWCKAATKEDAKDYLYGEYWDVSRVLNIRKA